MFENLKKKKEGCAACSGGISRTELKANLDSMQKMCRRTLDSGSHKYNALSLLC